LLIARLDKYTYLPVFILQQEDDSLYLQYRCGLIQRIQWTSSPYQLDLFYRIGWACPSVIFIDLCISYQKTNKINQLKSFIQSKEVYKGDSQYENLLNYFILKYKYQTDNDELSYFIVNKVPIIIDNTMGKYKQFFYEELSMLVEQTKRYKDLKTYLDSTSDMLPI
uniref:hypothetical protein n=1 Tax=Holdemanella porci TaxID=2652276 RepID=UPI002943CB84